MSRSRLETVVRIRTLQEQIARGEVERERRNVRQREDDVAHADQAVASRAAQYATSPTAFAAHRSMLDVGLRHVGMAEQRCDLARLEADRSVTEWTAASRKLEGVERLDERINALRQATEALTAQKEIDDLVVTRWKRGAA